jgi:ABC-type oligopeptide transport system substrate-binding subunit
MLDPATASPNASMLYDIQGARAFHQGQLSDPRQIGVRAMDDRTLVVELEEPTGHFLHLLGTKAQPIPRHVVERHGEAWTEVDRIVTNGPYQVEAWQPGHSIVLARNSLYHGSFKGNVQRVELSVLEDPSSGLELYEADDLDIVDAQLSDMDRVRARHAGEYVFVPQLCTWYVAFDVSLPPFDDVRVRRAFALATDRESLAHDVLKGHDVPALGGLVPPGMPGHSPGIGLPYDPDRARRLLAEAGYPGGHGFPAIPFMARDALISVCKSLQAQWRVNLGIELPWETRDWALFLEQLDSDPPAMSIQGWMADYPDPDNFLRTSAVQRVTRWRRETYDQLVEEARRLTDQAERMKLYRQADQILIEDAPIIPLTHWRWPLLLKPWVRALAISPMGHFAYKDAIIEPH